MKIICKYCNKQSIGRANKIFCNDNCKAKYYWKYNRERKSKQYSDWAKKNKEYVKITRDEYKSTEKYRIMKKRHDKNYRIKNGNKIIEIRTPEYKFKVACRAYAEHYVKKEKCILCSNTINLELHHSTGYIKQNIEGVIVVCKQCHQEVIHGKGYKCRS